MYVSLGLVNEGTGMLIFICSWTTSECFVFYFVLLFA